jgi:hypothetical protein
MNSLQPWIGPVTPLATLLAGIALLFFGRRLFWLFVGVIGFMAGWHFALGAWHQGATGGRLLLAVLAGLLGVVLALALQKVAIALAGFAVGAYLVADLLNWPLGALHPGQLLVVVIVGVAAAIVALMLFDLALIVLSALTGARLVVEAAPLHLAHELHLVALVVLAVIGIAVQWGWMSRGPRRPA